MKITVINAIDSRGGAAKVATDLINSLSSNIRSINYLVGHKTDNESTAEEISYSQKVAYKNHKLKTHGLLLPTFSILKNNQKIQDANVLHFHNLHLEPDGYFNILHLPKITKYKPSVLTIHDTWSIQERSLTPQYDFFFSGIPKWFHAIKRRSINNSKIIIVSPSQWLADLTARCYPNKTVSVIHNGVDTNIFNPKNKVQSRAELGLPKDKRIVLFVANEGESNIQKGTEYLNQLRENSSDEYSFVSIGSSKNNEYISNPEILAKYYSAADVFLLPSLAENFPLTLLESMACGTPCVAFDTGGVKEIIKHKVTGYVAEYKNLEDLKFGLNYVLQNTSKMGKKSTELVNEKFTLDQMRDSYLKLYSSII